MKFFGHTRAVLTLERNLPAVTLLIGPTSVGKWTLAQHLADYHNIQPTDRMEVETYLYIETIRHVLSFANMAPCGNYRLVIINLDGASKRCLTALLRTLEDPPPTAKFILISSQQLPDTLISRSSVFHLERLSQIELQGILVHKLGLTPTVAKQAANLGQGMVEPILRTIVVNRARGCALTVIRAVALGDQELFDRAFGYWDAAAQNQLVDLLCEVISGRWIKFSEADTLGLHNQQLKVRRMLLAINTFSDARPAINTRVALRPFILSSTGR